MAVSTYEQISHEGLDNITFISTKRIAAGNDGLPTTPEDQWGVVSVETLDAIMGGFLKRSPEGTLSLKLPWGQVWSSASRRTSSSTRVRRCEDVDRMPSKR